MQQHCIGKRPANNIAAVKVDNGEKVHVTIADGNIGDIHCPDLVRTVVGEPLPVSVCWRGGYSMCAASCASNVTVIKMEAGLPVGIFRSTNQTTSMMCWRKQRRMKR